MSLLLQQRDKDGKWRMWTTISDGWITDWLSETEMKAQIAAQYENDYKSKVIEEYMSFPDGWFDKGKHRLLQNQEGKKSYLNWLLEALRSNEYEVKLAQKFAEITKDLGGL